MRANNKVICINDNDTEFALTKGSIYVVEIIDHYGMVKVKGVHGNWAPIRFEVVVDNSFSLSEVYE